MKKSHLKLSASKEVNKYVLVFWEGIKNKDFSSKENCLKIINDLIKHREGFKHKAHDLSLGIEKTYRYTKLESAIKVIIDSLMYWMRKKYY